MPECVGNKNQQVLPIGVVCTQCNNYFGTKIEPKLLDDPYFHVIAVALSLVDPDDMNVFRNRIFDDTHRPEGQIQSHLSMKANINPKEITLDISYMIKGIMKKTYTKRGLNWLSRAVHKIAFESLAWVHFVKGTDTPLDLFSNQFDYVRLWAREGQPARSVRPVLRKMSSQLKAEVDTRHWKFGNAMGCEIRMFGDWYAVSLTSSPNDVIKDFKIWMPQPDEGIWCVYREFVPFSKL